MFKFLIIAGGLYYLYILVIKPNMEIDSNEHNEDNLNGNKSDDTNDDDNIEYTDYEEID